MLSKQEIRSLEKGVCHYPSRTVQIFKSIHLIRIFRKRIDEIGTDHGCKEFSCERWKKSPFFVQIHKFKVEPPFVQQFEKNNSWQINCGYQ